MVLECSEVPVLMKSESVSELYQLTRLPTTNVSGSASFKRRVEYTPFCLVTELTGPPRDELSMK
ncbi:hypothetical protein D3C81_2326190 [compost metagenome]